MMWTMKGKQLRSLEDLMSYIYHRYLNQISGQTALQKGHSHNFSGDDAPPPLGDVQPILIIVSINRPKKQMQIKPQENQNQMYEVSSSNDGSVAGKHMVPPINVQNQISNMTDGKRRGEFMGI